MSTLDDLDSAKAAAQAAVASCTTALQTSRLALGMALASLGVLTNRGAAVAATSAVGVAVVTNRPTAGPVLRKQIAAAQGSAATASATTATPATPAAPAVTYTSAMIPALIDDFTAKKSALQSAQKTLDDASAALSAAMKSK